MLAIVNYLIRLKPCLLIFVTVVQNFSGGTLCFIMVVYSFIADNSADRDRTLRLAILRFAAPAKQEQRYLPCHFYLVSPGT